ncbi:MAG: 16S rRNA (cytosine(1402)-N(4))-methyltransferase RsmH [Bacteroidetes bacterium]|nr:16S rRNA (cytosine(1402)-N(4))-methyltransferase RsmH [Bacteroidota bacterium]
MIFHVPVLLKESIEYLVTKEDGCYFDGTVGFGGHSQEILNRLNIKGKLIATDKDQSAFEYCKNRFEPDTRFSIYHTSFTNINSISKIEFIEEFDGIFADLGVSSYQLDNADSGFTFREDTLLDLRMNKNEGLSAADVLNGFSQDGIANILFEYGEEKNSKLIAKKIIEARQKEKILRTSQLRNIVETITPQRYLTKSLSRIFQALRIYVNNELNDLKVFLDKSIPLLKTGGRIVLLSYHSLEDRIVKEKFKYETLTCVCPPGTPICICGKKQRLKLITHKPIIPSNEEIILNKRSRSAKLRVAERV